MIAARSTLSPDQIGEIRDELLRTLTRLERSMKISGEAARPVELEQDTVGRLSRIDAIQNQGLAQNLQARERAQLACILDALRRIEEGSYGACSACGGAIRFERLLVFPETRTCAACATGC
ncbi:MAG TPA: TraR/DksA C4-type zinc finger protein [Longimicrobiaceae bacterium]|nr:TraR/DksA C4-type zinc finger protein [Longimicrobiaceae bacterium]